jgi:membrane protein
MSDGTATIPGQQAATPVQIPARGWWQMVRRPLAEATADHVPTLAGGVAFFAFLAVSAP